MTDISSKDIHGVVLKAIENIHLNSHAHNSGKPSYCYQDEDGLIHIGDESGFHCIMGQDFFEALLKTKEPKSTQDQIKDVFVDYIRQELDSKKRPDKPYYRKERW